MYTTDEEPQDICCTSETTSSTPVSLYAGGDSITGIATDIPPLTGIPTRTVSTVNQGG